MEPMGRVLFFNLACKGKYHIRKGRLIAGHEISAILHNQQENLGQQADQSHDQVSL